MRFRQKTLLCMVWLLTLSYGIGGAMLIDQSFRLALEERQTAAMTSYRMTLQTVQLVNAVDTQHNFFNISAALGRMGASADWTALRLQSDSRSLYVSGTVFSSLAADSGITQAVFTHGEDQYLQLSGPLTANAEELKLDIVYPISSIYQTRDAQIATYRRIFLVLLGTGGAVAWCLSYYLTRPLSRVSAASRRLARGELSARAKVRTRDEVGELASDFNRMARRLGENMEELTDSVRRQERFMGGFAHELKTPMTSIIGYADLLRSGALTEQEQAEAANYIFSEGKRLEALSMKMLQLLAAKQPTSVLVKTELLGLLRSLVKHLQPIYADAGIDLAIRGVEGFAMVDGDLFRSLMINLLDNARKAMEHGGNIAVTTCREEGSYVIRVTDNGCGMPEEALAHITEAFYRVDKSRSRKQGGVGLGLALCSQIVQLHGGTMDFASRPSAGTCVILRLPEVVT